MDRDTASVFSGVEFEPDRLDDFIRGILKDAKGAMRIERIVGGQSNPTFLVTYEGLRLVLRKQPTGKLLPSAHAIDREYRIQAALAATDVPVPHMLFYCEDREIVGTPFYVMKCVEGRVFRESSLPDVPIESRGSMYRSLAQNLATLHNVRPATVGLTDYGKIGDYYSRQIARWTAQWELSQARENRDIRLLIDWLAANLPVDEVTTIVHGDYRIGNMIFHPFRPHVAAVLDWELSSLGHPIADLAHTCIAWHSMPDEYGGLRELDLKELGIPDQRKYADMYYGTVQHHLRMTSYHMAFALFRFAVIFEGIAARARATNAASADAIRAGLLSPKFARRAVKLLDSDGV